MPPDAGPYRTPSRPSATPFPSRLPIFVALALALVALVAWLWPDAPDRVALDARDLPPRLVDSGRAFPPPEADLPIATPLVPLLATDRPESLAVLWPGEGGMRVRRGEVVTVRFNRPMVAATAVGHGLDDSPLRFSPAVEGSTRWTTRSTLTFTPTAVAFTRDIEAELSFAPGLTSVDGAVLEDEIQRVAVFDGTPRVSAGRHTIPVGEPIELRFDGPIRASELVRELFVYESGGGVRTVPVRAIARGRIARPDADTDESGTGDEYRVDLALRRALEPGTRVAVALAPRFSHWGGSEPHVLSFALEPRPRFDGIACDLGSGEWPSCAYDSAPGEVVDIGPELVLHATHALGDLDAGLVRVTPAVPSLAVSVEGADASRRLLVVRGEWAADQVYEVRIGATVTATGERIVAPAPLAVRSSGHAPAVVAPGGLTTVELDARPHLSVRGVNVGAGVVRTLVVPEGREAQLLLGLVPVDPALSSSTPLPVLLPSARPNRWGSGTLELDGGLGTPSMHVVSFEAAAAGGSTRAFVQATDLGISALGVTGGVLVWVTSIASGEPVEGGRVSAFSAAGVSLGDRSTDADGMTWLADPIGVAVLVARHGGDRAVMRFDARTGTGPSELGVHGGTGSADEGEMLRAHVVTDRGLYRPGENLHVVGLLRRVRGTELRPGARTAVTVRLVQGDDVVPVASSTVVSSGMGTIDATFEVPGDMPLGSARVEITDDDLTIGSTDIRVAEYREPRFRVDLALPEQVLAGDATLSALSAHYLFGAALGEATARYTATFESHAAFGSRWAEFSFAPVTSAPRRTTLAEGELALDAAGSATIPVAAPHLEPTRGALIVEVEVTDVAGEASATSGRIVVRAADAEVGIRRGAEWVRLGEPLVAEVVAVDGDDAPAPGAPLSVRFVREGWHAWWEWARDDAALTGEDGHFALRRAAGRQIVHRCTLTSALEPVRCEHAPSRAGTYVLEVEHRDAAGRVSMASRRVYVAGPDESPDRDPPGAPIELTPRTSVVMVGDDAELAFECPWPEAEALVVVSRAGVLHTERLHVAAGGHVVRIPATEAMAPNAFVTLTLVRPRTGPPGADLDLDAPDLRFGAAELRVRRPVRPLVVTFDAAPSEVRPGAAHTTSVRVTDADGRPVEAELALWATDEGTLRATGYALEDEGGSLYPRAAASFALEDLRRNLASRLAPSVEAEPSGDGGEAGESPMALEERERYEPTPLWAARLRTDVEGRATVTFDVPERATEYRIFALATDAEARSGHAESALVVSRPLVVRAALPRFLTEGDEATARAFVHNRTDADVTAEVVFTIDGGPRAPLTIDVPAHGEARVETELAPLEPGRVTIEIAARANAEVHSVTSALSVVPRGRWARARTLVMGESGSRSLEISFPPGTPSRGELVAVVAAHPFVGLESLADEIGDAWWSTAEIDAAVVLALASIARLEAGSVAPSLEWRERRARLGEHVARLLDRQSADGGFALYRGETSSPRLDTLVLRALLEARLAGVSDLDDAIEALTVRLRDAVAVGSFGGARGAAGVDDRMLALRLLTHLGRPDHAAVSSAYGTREFLGPAALANLALAMAPDDERRVTLATLARARLDEAALTSGVAPPAPWTRDVRALGAWIELEVETSRHRALGSIAGELFAAAETGSIVSRAEALSALVALALAFRGDDATGLALSLDGAPLTSSGVTPVAARFVVPFSDVATGTPHALRASRLGAEASTGSTPVFLSLSGLWSVPLGTLDETARGRRVALHRVLETPGGTPIEPGAEVAVGALVRVRLFVYVEGGTPDEIALRDPHAAGLEPLDAALETTPTATLLSVLGASPEDDTTDPRAHHALRSEADVREVVHEAHATTTYLRALGQGLHEYTYVVRAVTPGRFTMPPAQIEALDDETFVARSAASSVVVVP